MENAGAVNGHAYRLPRAFSRAGEAHAARLFQWVGVNCASDGRCGWRIAVHYSRRLSIMILQALIALAHATMREEIDIGLRR